VVCPKNRREVLEGIRHLLMRANGGWVWSRDDLRGLDDGAGEGLVGGEIDGCGP
jgi:hypothetical protein